MQIIRSILLPLVDVKLLLPDTTISEIVKVDFKPKKDDKISWYMGNLTWRDLNIPIISLENFDGNNIIYEQQTSIIAIFNLVIDNAKIDFLGFILDSFPKIVKVTKNDIDLISENAKSIFCYEIMLRGSKVNMVDLERLQKDVLNNLN